MRRAILFFSLLLWVGNTALAAVSVEKPIIGISIDNGDNPVVEASKLGMIERIQAAGGIPLILNDRGDRSPEKDIQHIDALVVQGDALDVDPAQYGAAKDPTTHIETDKTRTNYEDKIIPEALKDKMPVLLICGGMQRANVLMGGTLFQNIPDLKGVKPGHGDNNGKPPEEPSQPVEVVPGTLLARVTGRDTIMVNSFHHQALDKIGKGFRMSAYSDAYTRADGSKGNLVEAIDADPKGPFAGQYVLGLQFHPELMPDSPLSADIFRSFGKAAQKFVQDTGRHHEDEEVLQELSHRWKSANVHENSLQ